MCSTNVEENAAEEKDFFKLLLLLSLILRSQPENCICLGKGVLILLQNWQSSTLLTEDPPRPKFQGNTDWGKKIKIC